MIIKEMIATKDNFQDIITAIPVPEITEPSLTLPPSLSLIPLQITNNPNSSIRVPR